MARECVTLNRTERKLLAATFLVTILPLCTALPQPVQSHVPSGAWIVDEWLLKLPRLTVKQSAFIGQEYMLTGYHEHGGGILNGPPHTADSLNRKH